MQNGARSAAAVVGFICLITSSIACETQTQRVPPQNIGVGRREGQQSLDIHQLDPNAKPIIPTGPDNRDINPDSLTDPCAARLHDISGALLLYYASHHQMPAKLDDLKPLADAGSELQFTCAVNGAPFVYVSDGMAAPNKEKRIVVYDPTPIGKPRFRWCLMASVTNSGAIATDVVPLAEDVFNTYHASSPGATPATPNP